MAPKSPACSFIHASMVGSRSTAPLNRSNSVLIVAPHQDGRPQTRGVSTGLSSGSETLLRLGPGPGKPFLQHIDLSSVVRFVLANMKPLAVVVCGSPRPGLVDCHQPGVVMLTKFRELFLASLPQSV